MPFPRTAPHPEQTKQGYEILGMGQLSIEENAAEMTARKFSAIDQRVVTFFIDSHLSVRYTAKITQVLNSLKWWLTWYY